MEDKKVLLEARHLVKEFPIGGTKKRPQVVHAVSDVNLEIYGGETLALVGESGCGKSTLGRTLIRLLEATSGEIYFDGEEIISMKPGEFAALRRQMQIIFQDPYASLNPRMRVREIIGEPLITYGMKDKQELEKRVRELMKEVGIPDEFYNRYPHQFSGGQRQRISIARAILKNPPILILDEATSALDTESERLVQEALERLMKTRTTIAIAHRLSTIRNADEICVLYEGEIVERGRHEELLAKDGYYKKLNDMQSLG